MTGSSVGSSGVWGIKSESSTPSPPQQSHSAPVSVVFGSSIDEGIELDESRLYFSDDWKTKDPVCSLQDLYTLLFFNNQGNNIPLPGMLLSQYLMS